MKLLIVTPSYKPAFTYGGPTFSVSKHAEMISSLVDLQVITTTANGENELNVNVGVNVIVDNVNVIYFYRQTKDHSHFSFGLLKYLWDNCKRYDVIHIQSWWNLVSLFSVIICVVKDSKVVISPRGMLSNYTINSSRLKSAVHYFFKFFLYNRFYFHLTSQYELIQTINLNTKYKFIIPNFLLTKEYINKPIDDKNGLLFLSRIDKKKNIEVLIKAMQYLPKQVELNIVGQAEVNYFKYLKSIVPYNAIDRINWLGQIYGDRKNIIIAKSRILVLTSYDENFANIVLESLLHGTAVVISNNVGLSDFVIKYNLGWVVNLNDKLEDVLNEALLDIEKLNYINNNAREIVLREFNDSILQKQYLNMYKNIIND